MEIKICFTANIGTGHDVLYQGTCRNDQLKGFDVILDGSSEDLSVLIQNNIKGKEGTIRTDEIVGRISSLVEINKELEENQETEGEFTLEHLKVDKNLTAEEVEKVKAMLRKTKNVYGKDSNDIGQLKVEPAVIELTDHTPIWQKPRCFPEPTNQEIDKQCEELEALDIISKTNSPWSSPVVPVWKLDKSLRMCIDYRKLNKVTKTKHFPIPT